MKYLAAYALLTLSGKKEISANDIKGVLTSVQANASDEEINRVLTTLKGKSVHQLIADGQVKLGGAAPVAAGKAEKADKAPKKEEAKKKQQPKKKEEPAPKVEEEEDFGLDGGLFG